MSVQNHPTRSRSTPAADVADARSVPSAPTGTPQAVSTAVDESLPGPVTESLRLRRTLGVAWLLFVAVNLWFMVHYLGRETIPYHLIWASFALLYGLLRSSRRATVVTFLAVSVATGVPLIEHARIGALEWTECSEIVLMGLIVALLIWHVDRHRATQQRISELLQSERTRAQNREVTAKFGSHEVRTRLTVARGLVEIIRNTTPDASIQDDAVTVLREIDKATATATKLLDLVRVETPSPPAKVQVDNLVRVMVGRWAAAVERTWAASSSVGYALADAERLEAALDCLIENAVKFTATGDTIEVNGRLEGGNVILSVSDTGAGIPPEDLERIFNLFQIGSTAGERAGSGLGLALVNATMEDRHGTVTVTSQVDAGSCFTMTFPATPRLDEQSELC